MFTSWDAGKMSSFIKLHVTNITFVFVATFRKYLGSFVEERFLISFHYTQFLFEAEIAPLCTALHSFYTHLRVLRWTISLKIGGHHFLVSRWSFIAQCPLHVSDQKTISCGYCSVAWMGELSCRCNASWTYRR